MNTISIDDYTLFKPVELAKGLTLQNRVVYRPCTRGRADLKTRIPTEHVAKYYEARASAGLIVTEGLGISEQGYGWYGTPALYTNEQAEGWRRVVDGVHARGGKMFAQLWHMGRLSHSSFHEGRQVASCSAGRNESGRTHHGVTGEPVPYETSRPMTLAEIKRVVEDYQHSAELAKLAGFDGVEVQCGGGYLIDEFLQSISNQRTDEYGGSFENRFRLLREVIVAITSVFPANRVGILVSPNFKFGGLGSPDNFDMFSFVIRELSKLNLAYLVTQDGMGPEFQHSWRKFTLVEIKTLFQGTVVTTGNHSRDTGEGALRTGAADLVGYVRPFMVNPDLVERFLHDWPLNDPLGYEFYWDPKKGVEGYLDFKAYDAAQDDKATTQNTQ